MKVVKIKDSSSLVLFQSIQGNQRFFKISLMGMGVGLRESFMLIGPVKGLTKRRHQQVKTLFEDINRLFKSYDQWNDFSINEMDLTRFLGDHLKQVEVKSLLKL